MLNQVKLTRYRIGNQSAKKSNTYSRQKSVRGYSWGLGESGAKAMRTGWANTATETLRGNTRALKTRCRSEIPTNGTCKTQCKHQLSINEAATRNLTRVGGPMEEEVMLTTTKVATRTEVAEEQAPEIRPVVNIGISNTVGGAVDEAAIEAVAEVEVEIVVVEVEAAIREGLEEATSPSTMLAVADTAGADRAEDSRTNSGKTRITMIMSLNTEVMHIMRPFQLSGPEGLEEGREIMVVVAGE